MLFYQRLITLIFFLLFIPSSVNTVIQFIGYVKKMKIYQHTKATTHPLKRSLIQSIGATAVLLVGFYLFGGFGFLHSYLYPIKEVNVKIVRIHDTLKVKLYDTVYIKHGTKIENQIHQVKTLNQY